MQRDPFRCYKVFLWMLAPLVAFCWSVTLWGQAARYEAGDRIEVYFLNKWWPATVVDTNRQGAVLAEFEFAGQQKRQGFSKQQVRRPYEADALSRGRMWADASEKFKIRAALLEIDGDQVTLRKEDMTEIKVPTDKLSDADQRFVKRLAKDAGGVTSRAPSLPPLTTFSVASTGSRPIAFSGSDRQALEADAAPSYQKIQQGGTAFELENNFDRLGAVLPIGGRDAWVLAAVVNNTPGGNLPTRLLWTSLDKQKVEGRQLLPPGEVVMDYHPPSHRLLTFAEIEGESLSDSKGALTLWEVVPAETKAKPLVRWEAQGEKRLPHEPWARLADGQTVIQKWADHEFVGWNVDRKAMVYRTTQESFFAPSPVLSPGRKYLFVPEDKQIRILDSRTGNQLSVLPAEDGSSGVAVTEDGRRAAVLSRNLLRVWDLVEPQSEPDEYPAEAIGTPFGAKLRWVDPNHLMIDQGPRRQVLFSLEHNLALWNYRFDSSAIDDSGGRRLRDIVKGHLVYAASVSSGTDRGLAVGAVELPGPKVDEIAAELDPDTLMIVKPGSPMRLVVDAGENQAQVQTALEEKIKANGWILDSTASAVMTADMTRGERQQVTYRVFGTGAEQKATVTPYVSTLKIEVGGKVAWQSGTSSGVPPVVSLEKGKSVQAEVDRWQRPNVGFFEAVEVPDRILDPDKRHGLGTTQVSNRGLVVEKG